MKKLMISLALTGAALAPMASSADENRLNLWPLLSVEDDSVDIIWPIGHFEDARHWRVFPIVKDGDLFCLFPELWMADDGFALLPLMARYDFQSGGILPLVWWDVANQFSTVFPLYYYNANASDDLTFWAACGLGGVVKESGKVKSHWMLPVYGKWSNGDFWSLPYARTTDWHGVRKDLFLCGLGGYKSNDKSEVVANWCFPLWHKDKDGFTSLPYTYRVTDDGKLDSWMSLPALSGAWRDGSMWTELYLAGLLGRSVESDGSFSGSWALPLYYADSDGTFVTAVYGQTPDARWGLPGWYRNQESFISPLWYRHTAKDGETDRWMMPLLLSGGSSKDGVRENGFLLGLAGNKTTDDGFSSSWCFPLYYANNEGTFATPIYGQSKTTQWCFPLWYKDETSLYSGLWCEKRDADGSLKSWSVPLLLSGCEEKDDGSTELNVLLGLGGARWNERSGTCSSWAFPFYYSDGAGSFVTPLAGRKGKSNWLAPLYYYDGDAGDFVSFPYAHLRNWNSDTYTFPPLLSWLTVDKKGGTDLTAFLLYGHKTDEKGRTINDHFFPLYTYNGVSKEFVSPLFGSVKDDGHRKTWWATPLAGTYSEGKTGGWLFPLFNRKKDPGFDRLAADLSSDVLPADRDLSKDAFAQVTGSVFLGSDHDHSVRATSGKDDQYQLHENYKKGNRLFFNTEGSRTVTFDKTTRRKEGERVDSKTVLLGGLFSREHTSDTQRGQSHTHTRVLWKLWDREERNGDVTLDAFPGFAHDSRKDGYTRTSFLWRLFRYESDPQKGVTLDLAFLPLRRP